MINISHPSIEQLHSRPMVEVLLLYPNLEVREELMRAREVAETLEPECGLQAQWFVKAIAKDPEKDLWVYELAQTNWGPFLMDRQCGC